MLRPSSLALALTASLAASSPVFAQTVYRVDDDGGPGIDFTEVQDAVDVAVPGDRIEVLPGFYDQVTIGRGITIFGESVPGNDVRFINGVRVAGLPAGEILVLADLAGIGRIELMDSDGAIIMDRVNVKGTVVERCADVRFQEVNFRSGGGLDCRFQDSLVQAMSCFSPDTVEVIDADVVFSDTELYGQQGAPGDCGFTSGRGGDGTDALVASGASSVWLLRSPILGGIGGFGCFFNDGDNGVAVRASDQTRVIRCKEYFPNAQGTIWSAPPNSFELTGLATLEDVEDLPSMTLTGAHRPGLVSGLQAYAGVGTSVRMFLGRRPVVVPFLNDVPLLHTAERGASLGEAPPSELINVPFTVPALPRGTLIFVQASRTRTGGQTRLSNGPCLIVR